MNVINPNNITHEIQVIPRYYSDSDTITLVLYDEASQEETIITLDNPAFSFSNNFVFLEDFLQVKFNFTFLEGNRFQFKIVDNTEIVYRGKIIATTQETQNYLTDKNEYYYE